MNRPWLQFYTRDWLDSKELRRCSPEARALLADLMCLAHEGEPYGYLADRIGPLSDDYMSSRCAMSLARFRRAFIELVRNERLAQQEGRFMVPRMVKDEEIRQKRAAGGSLGGNPELTGKVNHEVNHEVNLPSNLTIESKVNQPFARARVGASDSDSVSELAFEFGFLEWWEIWSKVRGTARKNQAFQMWISLCVDHESVIECTRSYLASIENPAKGYHPENFLQEQSRDGFSARWPPFRKRTEREALRAAEPERVKYDGPMETGAELLARMEGK